MNARGETLEQSIARTYREHGLDVGTIQYQGGSWRVTAQPRDAPATQPAAPALPLGLAELMGRAILHEQGDAEWACGCHAVDRPGHLTLTACGPPVLNDCALAAAVRGAIIRRRFDTNAVVVTGQP